MLNYPSFSRSEHCQDGFAIDELGCNTSANRGRQGRFDLIFWFN
jgi:hypothetical protein